LPTSNDQLPNGTRVICTLGVVIPELGIDRRLPPNRLPEAQDVAVTIAYGELLHVVRLLHDRPVDDKSAATLQLVVQRVHIAHPEECVPRSTLAFVGTDVPGHSSQHDAMAIA